jgi:hypothetical protein
MILYRFLKRRFQAHHPFIDGGGIALVECDHLLACLVSPDELQGIKDSRLLATWTIGIDNRRHLPVRVNRQELGSVLLTLSWYRWKLSDRRGPSPRVAALLSPDLALDGNKNQSRRLHRHTIGRPMKRRSAGFSMRII